MPGVKGMKHPTQIDNQNAAKEMNWDLLDNLIGIFCTLEECSACLELSETTINSKIKEKFGISFCDYFKQKASKGRASLRRRQFEMSKTNPALCIWLGKQYLGQADSPMIDQSSHHTFQVVNYGKEIGVDRKNPHRLIPTT